MKGTSPLERAQAFVEIGRLDEALPLLQGFLANDPEHYEGLCLLGHVYFLKEDHKSALKAGERAVTVDPERDWGHRVRAAALLKLKRKKEAALAARESARAAPDDAGTLSFLAEVESEAGNHQEAQVAAKRAVELDPGSVDGHHALGFILLNQRKWREAEQQFRKVLEINPENFEAMNNLGVALVNQSAPGKSQQAVDILTRASKLNPGSELARDNLMAGIRKTLFASVFLVWLVFRLASEVVSDDAAGLLALAAALVGLTLVVRGLVKYRQLPIEARVYFKARSAAYMPKVWAMVLLVGAVMCLLFGLVWIPDPSSRPGLLGIMITVLILGSTTIVAAVKVGQHLVTRRWRRRA